MVQVWRMSLIGRDEQFSVAIKSPESGRPNLAATPGLVYSPLPAVRTCKWTAAGGPPTPLLRQISVKNHLSHSSTLRLESGREDMAAYRRTLSGDEW
jgi:hypothetical protein